MPVLMTIRISESFLLMLQLIHRFLFHNSRSRGSPRCSRVGDGPFCFCLCLSFQCFLFGVKGDLPNIARIQKTSQLAFSKRPFSSCCQLSEPRHYLAKPGTRVIPGCFLTYNCCTQLDNQVEESSFRNIAFLFYIQFADQCSLSNIFSGP